MLGLAGFAVLGWFGVELLPRVVRAFAKAFDRVFGLDSPIESVALRFGALFTAIYVLGHVIVRGLESWLRVQDAERRSRIDRSP